MTTLYWYALENNIFPYCQFESVACGMCGKDTVLKKKCFELPFSLHIMDPFSFTNIPVASETRARP